MSGFLGVPQTHLCFSWSGVLLKSVHIRMDLVPSNLRMSQINWRGTPFPVNTIDCKIDYCSLQKYLNLPVELHC